MRELVRRHYPTSSDYRRALHSTTTLLRSPTALPRFRPAAFHAVTAQGCASGGARCRRAITRPPASQAAGNQAKRMGDDAAGGVGMPWGARGAAPLSTPSAKMARKVRIRRRRQMHPRTKVIRQALGRSRAECCPRPSKRGILGGGSDSDAEGGAAGRPMIAPFGFALRPLNRASTSPPLPHGQGGGRGLSQQGPQLARTPLGLPA
jgi:hypothetical protein